MMLTQAAEADMKGDGDLGFKIARLVEERGWNQEDFSRIANLNRHTVRLILHGAPNRRLRNATVSQCAEALGLSVNEMRTQTLERLLPRMHGKPAADDEALKMLMDRATIPELINWLERNQSRAAELRPDEVGEMLDMQQPGGALEKLGVEQVVEMIERKRKVLGRARVIANSDFLPLLEQMIDLMFEKVARNAPK